MDINGAKALKERLGMKGADDAPSASVDVPADAPPVYHWLGVSQPADPQLADPDDEAAPSSVSLFRRLGFSFR